MSRWLRIVGIGDDGLEGLAPTARALVDGAQVLVGGARHLAMVPEDDRERIRWPTPLSDIRPLLEARRGRPVCVLATGDPLCYGVGAKLHRWFDRDEIAVVPAPSAFSLACARLGWSLPDVETLTLHGRPLETLAAYLADQNEQLRALGEIAHEMQVTLFERSVDEGSFEEFDPADPVGHLDKGKVVGVLLVEGVGRLKVTVDLGEHPELGRILATIAEIRHAALGHVRTFFDHHNDTTEER